MTAARRPVDPGRRDRIVDACLDVVAEAGVAGASARRVAAAADVPLGSVTYYFDGMSALVAEAFDRFATTMSDRFAAGLAAADDLRAASDAIVATIEAAGDGDQRDLVLAHELYTLAARDPAFRSITNRWMARSRAALESHVDPDTARVLDALVEGLTVHRSLDVERHPAGLARHAVDAVLAAATR